VGGDAGAHDSRAEDSDFINAFHKKVSSGARVAPLGKGERAWTRGVTEQSIVMDGRPRRVSGEG
jgi:hypothetical protein